MNKNTFILICSIVSFEVSAQEIITTQGESYSNTSANIDFTLGEVLTNTVTDGTTTLTQGFHQTTWQIVGLEDHVTNYSAIIFPNPTEDILTIQTSSFKNVTYTLYDAHGKLVMQNILLEEQTPIQVSHLAQGSYSLELIIKNDTKGSLNSTKLKTFILIKKS